MDDERPRTGRARAGGHGRANGQRDRGPGDGMGGATLQANFRALIGVAMIEATNRGSALVEAEHLLLGFLFDRHGRGTEILAEHGLTYDAFDQALARDREQTLAAVGIEMPDPARLAAAPRVRSGRPRFGASAKESWHRAARDARNRRRRGGRWSDLDLLIGIFAAELGTVPRALEQGEFDRHELLAALREAQEADAQAANTTDNYGRTPR